MNAISVINLSKSVKDENLFSEVTFGLDSGEHLGLIGKNGAGKSTFMKILAGFTEPDTGSVVINNSCKVGYLSQEVCYDKNDSVLQYLYKIDDPEIEILKRYNNGDNSVTEKAETLHVWDIETRYKRYLKELGFNEDLNGKMADLSGGEQKKAAIAGILATEPDILLLDEPTNHLDIDSVEWLESFLKNETFTIILVTHDRYFLDNVCSKIMEIDRHKAYFYQGGYSDFLQQREERLSALQKEQDRLATILRREIEWLRRGPKARTGKDSGRKQRIEQMQSLQTHEEEADRDFSSISRRLGKKILKLKDLTVKRNGQTVIDSFSLEFVKGMRIGVIGPNGSGKSTLLDTITGRLEATSGILDIGVNTIFGYYDQKSELLPLNKTPLEYFSDISQNIAVDKDYSVTPARFLELFGFPSSFHRLPISTFSGGEKRRLYLLSQLVKNPNFLVLDEPTNDLDIDTIHRLEQYIFSFSGVVLIVSHDRAFLDLTCNELIIMPEQTRFEGNYSDYRSGKTENDTQISVEHIQTKTKTHDAKKGLSFKEKKEFETIEAEIESLEQEKTDLETWFANGNLDTDGTQKKRYEQIGTLIEEKYERWEYLSNKNV